MPNSAEILSDFIPLFDAEKREGTNYIELHPAELSEPHTCWLSGSMLLRDSAFDFFAECFFRADPDFDYFSSQKLDEREIQILLQEINHFMGSLRNAPTEEELFSRYTSLFGHGMWSEVPHESLVASVLFCGETLSAFISVHTAESKVLWVLGM